MRPMLTPMVTFFMIAATPIHAACTREDIDDPIATKTAPFGANHPATGMLFTEINKQLQMYNTYYSQKEQGMFIYTVKITNNQQRKGNTVCSCLVFSNSRDNFPLVSLGGKWGIGPRGGGGTVTRTETMNYQTAPAMIPLIDQVTVHAGYCPSNRVWRGVEKFVLDSSYAAARAYAIRWGVPKEALPEKRPGS